MSVDLSAELSSLSLQGTSLSPSSGTATPNALRSATGSGAVSPPSTTEQHQQTHSQHHLHVPGGLNTLVHSASPGSQSANGSNSLDDLAAAAGDLKAVADKRMGRPVRQLEPSERRTIFLPGLPRDVTQRELHNLFAFSEGFLKVQLYDSKDASASGKDITAATKPSSSPSTVGAGSEKEGIPASPQSAPVPSPGSNTSNPHGRELTQLGCFALFENAHQAALARERLQGYVFDPSASPPVVLQARLALKNLVLTREETDSLSAAAALTASSKSSRRSSMSHAAAVIPIDSPYQPTSGSTTFSPLTSPQPHSVQAYGIHSGYGSPALGPVYAHPQALTPPALAHMGSPAVPYYSESNLSVSNGAATVQQAGGVFSGVYNAGGVLNAAFQSQHNGHYANGNGTSNGHHTHGGRHHHHHHGHGHGHHSQAGPNNPPCTTLFLARLDLVPDEELLALLWNTFGAQVLDSKLMLDSRGQRIAFVEFDSLETSAAALPRIHGYLGITAAYSRNPLGKRIV